MKYAFPQLNHKSRFYTYGAVKRILELGGHVLVNDINDDCDAVLFSMADVIDMRELRKLRAETTKTIIVGGHYAFNFWSAILYSDIVWIGEIFDFADLQSIGEIVSSNYSYTGCEAWNDLRASSRIEWDKLPVVQQMTTRAYYLGGIGCKNNCKFCFTSWTHKHQKNSDVNIQAARKIAKDNKLYLMVVSNEYDYDPGTQTRDMMLVDYIKSQVSGGFVRLGVEFATEESRRTLGKPITRDELYAAIQKATIDDVALRLFHIAGYDKIDDWNSYIYDMARMLHHSPNKRLVHLKFTNLQYQNYTPLYALRREIDPDKYITGDDTRRWYNHLRQYSRHVLVGRPSGFGHVAYRMGVELSTDRKQSEYWIGIYGKRNKLPNEILYRALFDTGIMDTPRVILKRKTGKISVLDTLKGGA